MPSIGGGYATDRGREPVVGQSGTAAVLGIWPVLNVRSDDDALPRARSTTKSLVRSAPTVRTNSLPTTRPAGSLPALPDNDGRDMGCKVPTSPAVRRYRTWDEAVRSPRLLGKACEGWQFWRGPPQA